MELLAPAGNMESFLAAVQAGADAVYVGAPALNARNLARDLRLDEIATMIQYCRDHGQKLYLAANSLVREQDLPQVIATLAVLEDLRPDALIVQDLGLVRLVQRYFPSLPLHASTLMAAHNSEAVRAFAGLGFERVVLARELTLKEIETICEKTDVEIEVFVHGAMCFSYSGLCLFSSFLGGKSGLRGRCVQPCRRQYTWGCKEGGRPGAKGGRHDGRQFNATKGGKGSYLFSMNDLGGLEAVPLLARAGVASLKIEGRLRTAHYVSHVVQAYRMVMDAPPDTLPQILEKATALADKAMSRKVSPGYFLTPQPLEAITPYHSGNIGQHLGRLGDIRQRKGGLYGSLILKESLELGDRLRLHFEASGERHSFTLQGIVRAGTVVEQAETGEQVQVLLPTEASNIKAGAVELYKVDVRERPVVGGAGVDLPSSHEMRTRVSAIQERRKGRVTMITREVCLTADKEARLPSLGVKGKSDGRLRGGQRKSGPAKVKPPLEWWLKTDSVRLLREQLPFSPDRFLVPVDKAALSQIGQLKRYLGQGIRRITWYLPPIVPEQELPQLQKQVVTLVRSGFKSFQIGHLSQFRMFQGERVHLSGDYTLNLMNNQALAFLQDLGAEAAQLSIEADRPLLADLIKGCRTNLQHIRKGLTVYGAPALFTARLASRHFLYDRTLVSPKGESFVLRKKEGLTRAVPCRPFSLLPYLGELRDMGLEYIVVDLSYLPTSQSDLLALADRINGTGRMTKLPTFNYLGTLE